MIDLFVNFDFNLRYSGRIQTILETLEDGKGKVINFSKLKFKYISLNLFHSVGVRNEQWTTN